MNDLLIVYGVYFEGSEKIFDEMYSYLASAIRTGRTADLPQVFHQVIMPTAIYQVFKHGGSRHGCVNGDMGVAMG